MNSLRQKSLWFATLLTLTGCGQKAFLPDIEALVANNTSITSGDILIVSGGTTARTATPFPLHMITAFGSNGAFKKVVRTASSTEFYMGAALSFDLTRLLYTVDTTDRVESVSLNDVTNYGNHIIDGNLTGTTLRAVAVLSDGGTIVAESTTSIEKYNASGTRVTTNFPITLTANIMKLRKISGGRFVALTTGGTPDSPRIYNDAGVLQSTVSLAGLACTTNCDPSDIVELADGRFVIAVQAAASNSLELYSSTFTYIGQLYKDTNVLQTISAIAQTSDGDLVACSTAFNTCEKIQINGSTGVRVGTSAFIGDASLIRQPTDIVVIP